jgi:hypothetical protein
MSACACASLRGPPGGMLPPNQLRHDPFFARSEPVPLMYPWLDSHEYAEDADRICEWQLWQRPVDPLER